MDYPDCSTARRTRRYALHVVIRWTAVEAKGLCGWCANSGHDICHVPTLAFGTSTRSLVSQHGLLWSYRSVLRHGHLPTNSILHHYVHPRSRTLAIPESLRGCWLL